MTAPSIEISDQPNPEAERILGSGLAAFNESITGYNDRRPLMVLIKEPETDQIIGGISGKPPWEWPFSTSSTCLNTCGVRAWAANCCKPLKTKPGVGVLATRCSIP